MCIRDRCTYNRGESLATALESVAASHMPDSVDWEVLVVDNNSTDRTRAVVEEFCQRPHSRFRYIFEHQQGKSYALNTGIHEARGEILAFLDDDVIVGANWLQNLTAVFRGNDWAGAGGPVLPNGAFVPPAWLSLEGKYALAPLAIFDLGPQPGELVEAPFGTNMAFRKEVFEKVGGFRTDLGPRPGPVTHSEDTEFGFRALAAGQRLWYEPSAIVYHLLPAHRLQKEYFLAWWHDKARADIRAFGLPQGRRLQIAGVPLYIFRRLANWTLRWITAIHPARRFSCKLKVWIILGEIAECYRLPEKVLKRQGEIVSKKTSRHSVSRLELLDDLDTPFKSALLSMYHAVPQLGADGQQHSLDEKVKISPDEGMWLYEECRKSKPEKILEIGLGYGFSTLFFLAALAKNNFGHHTAIDPYQRSAWQGIGLATANALAPPGRFRFVEETSVRAAVELERESLAYDLIFIDGGHIFEQVLVDFFLYAKLCKIGGLVILDDMWMSGIKTVASFIRTNRKDFSEIPTPIPNLCVFQRVGKDERKWHEFRPFVVDQHQPQVFDES